MANETTLTLIGNLTSDLDLRYTQAGKPVANGTIASTPRSFDRNSNEWKDGEPLFMRFSVWGAFAEHVAGSLTKGSRVIAHGLLKQRSYQDKDGQTRTAVELDIQAIGPDLRYATATVTRAAASGASAAGSGASWGSDTTPPATTPQGGAQQWATTPAGGADYGDSTPF